MKKTFTARLTPRGPGGAWVFLPIPFNVEETFGSKARVPVAGTLNGFAFRNSLLPQGDGTHAMAVSKELRAGAQASAGDLVAVVLQVDQAERIVSIPPELEAVLSKSKKLSQAFAALAPSHRKEFADWIGSAKKAETRLGRADKAVAMIQKKAHLS
jgi:hypothetical protein